MSLPCRGKERSGATQVRLLFGWGQGGWLKRFLVGLLGGCCPFGGEQPSPRGGGDLASLPNGTTRLAEWAHIPIA